MGNVDLAYDTLRALKLEFVWVPLSKALTVLYFRNKYNRITIVKPSRECRFVSLQFYGKHINMSNFRTLTIFIFKTLNWDSFDGLTLIARQFIE